MLLIFFATSESLGWKLPERYVSASTPCITSSTFLALVKTVTGFGSACSTARCKLSSASFIFCGLLGGSFAAGRACTTAAPEASAFPLYGEVDSDRWAIPEVSAGLRPTAANSLMLTIPNQFRVQTHRGFRFLLLG